MQSLSCQSRGGHVGGLSVKQRDGDHVGGAKQLISFPFLSLWGQLKTSNLSAGNLRKTQPRWFDT